MKKKSSSIRLEIKSHAQVPTCGIIGEGALGKVYIANHKKSGKKVALKVISNQNLKSSARKRFYQNEVRTLNYLKGKTNIVEIIESFQLSNNVCIAMELCEKGTLRELMNNGPLEKEKTLQIMKQILSGYMEIVKAQIVHRDLKPSNILINKENEIKIADFGFAVFSSQLDQEINNNVGSTFYMPPEALKNNRYSYKSDVWALGVILYELLVGKKPWDIHNQDSFYHVISTVPIDTLIPQSIQGNLRQFIKRSIEPNLQNRASPQQLMQIFQSDSYSPPYKNQINTQSVKKTTNIMISLIDLCRLKFQIIKVIQDQKVNEQNDWKQLYQSNAFEKLRNALSGDLLRQLTQIQTLDYFSPEKKRIYEKSKEFKGLKQVLHGYWNKYFPMYQYSEQVSSKSSMIQVLQICQKNISQTHEYINLIFYDYLICIKQFQRLIDEKGVEQFGNISKIRQIVEGIKKELASKERKSIKTDSIKSLQNKLKLLHIIH